MMRQKLGDPIDGMGGNAAEDIFEPSEWINSSTLAGSDKAAQHGSRSTADIAAEKQPVATTYCDPADALFSPVIVDLEVTLVGVATQCHPVFKCIAHGPARRTLRQNLYLDVQQILVQFV